tara:strand:- start:117 stop:365 length:249 start_codon:yes stop_codon:yes gene_type:complete
MGIKKLKNRQTYYHSETGKKLTVDKLETFMYGNNKPYLITQYGELKEGTPQELRISEEEWESMKNILVDNNGWVKDEQSETW